MKEVNCPKKSDRQLKTLAEISKKKQPKTLTQNKDIAKQEGNIAEKKFKKTKERKVTPLKAKTFENEKKIRKLKNK